MWGAYPLDPACINTHESTHGFTHRLDLNLTSIEKNSFSKTKTKLNAKDIAKHFVKLEERIYKCDLAFINDLITQELPSDRWIHFLDSDDYLKRDCMQRTIESLDSLKAIREEIEIVARDVILFTMKIVVRGEVAPISSLRDPFTP